MTKVSVVIPVYGVENYISSTLNSVLKQTYSNFEVIIVDDESPDNSYDICQKYADPRIKIIRQSNRGLAGARNTGIRHSVGEFIALLDGDDLWLPEKLEKHVAHLETTPDVGISFSPSELIDESGSRTGTFLMPQLTDITPVSFLRANPIGNGSSPVIRRAVLEEIKYKDNSKEPGEYWYFDENFRRAEDLECWLRVALQTSWKFEGLAEPLTLYRVNSGGLSSSLFQQLDSLNLVLDKVNQYAPDFILREGSLAKAFLMKYLSRTAIRLQDGKAAVHLINSALREDMRVLKKDPYRTILTILAAYSLFLLPDFVNRSLYQVISYFYKIFQKNKMASAGS